MYYNKNVIKIERSNKMKVVCIDNTNQEEQLTIGKQYKVIRVGKLQDELLIIADDKREWRMSRERFKEIK